VLDGPASWDDVPGALRTHGDFVRGFVEEQGVQTNEVRRSWLLLPAFLEVARRTGAQKLDLVELGPSAGLNLVWDRYRYRYADGEWGSSDALLELAGEERRPVPGSLLRRRLSVRDRVGIDIAPVDLTTNDGARLLESFVWADQTERLERLRQAVATLLEEPPQLVRGDVVEELPRVLAGRRAGALTVVYQTAVLGYLPRERKERVYEALDAAAAESPLAYVGTHAPATGDETYQAVAIRVWPDEREAVAHADFHGAWLEWLA
jgi:hypothetical protein